MSLLVIVCVCSIGPYEDHVSFNSKVEIQQTMTDSIDSNNLRYAQLILFVLCKQDRLYSVVMFIQSFCNYL